MTCKAASCTSNIKASSLSGTALQATKHWTRLCTGSLGNLQRLPASLEPFPIASACDTRSLSSGKADVLAAPISPGSENDWLDQKTAMPETTHSVSGIRSTKRTRKRSIQLFPVERHQLRTFHSAGGACADLVTKNCRSSDQSWDRITDCHLAASRT